MKVLHVYAGNLFGGVETLLVTLAREQNLCSQMQPQFALCFEGRLATELDATGVCVHMLGNVRVSRPWTVWRARSLLDQLLRKESFDVIICHCCWAQAIFGSVVRGQQLPLVYWCHETLSGNHWLERWASQTRPDKAIAISHHTFATLPKVYPGIDSNILYNPVPPPKIGSRALVRQTIRRELNTPDDATVIIQASRLEPWKGQTLLLSALGQLREVPSWMCWIAGGAQRPREAVYLQLLQEKTQQLGIAQRVEFLGERADVPWLLAAADIYCQPNTGPEPFGIAFVEALYAGLPVVTTAMGGGMEIVDESCGWLVAPDDERALSQALRSLITNSAERKKLAAGGLARAEQLCNPARQMRSLHEILSGVVRQKKLASGSIIKLH